MLRRVLTTLLTLGSITTNAQFNDIFADGNFTANPVWTGEAAKFEIIGQVLHLNDAAASGTAFLSTPSEAVANATWEAYVEITANPSASNYARIYLMADQANISGNVDGYFVRVGGSEDDVSLYRQDGASTTKIIDGTDGRVDADPVQITVRVTRDASGNWQLFSQPTGAPDFVLEGAVNDKTHVVSTHSGVYCQYTSTRKEAFYFDNFSVTGAPQPDVTPPTVEDLTVLSATQLQLTWSEDVTLTSAQRAENYALSTRPIAAVQTPDARTVVLTWNDPLANGATSALTVRNVADEAGNTMRDTISTFYYFVKVPAQWQDVVINELMPDPNPVVATLPDAEFVELYNRSSHPFQLQNWALNEKALPQHLLLPNEYVLLSTTTAAAAFTTYGDTRGLSSWPTLPNGGGEIVLKDADGLVVDSLRYSEADVTGGYSIERIRQQPPCDRRPNHKTTQSTEGGTPGAQNASFTNQPDTQPPALQQVTVAAPREVQLHFDEAVNPANLTVTLSPTLGISEAATDPADERIVLLRLSEDLLAGSPYGVIVNDARDCYGNQAGTLTASFAYDNIAPALMRVAVRDTTALVLIFDEKLASNGEEEHYVIDNGVGKARVVALRSDSASVLLDFSASLNNGLVNQLRVAGATDRAGNVADTLVQHFKFQNDIDSVWVVSAYQVNVAFAVAPAPASAEQGQNYRLDRKLGAPNVAVRLSDHEVQLIYDRPLEADKTYELQMDNLQTPTGSWLSTPIYRFDYDQKAPALDSVVAVDPRTLIAHFSEEMQATASPSAFTVDQRIGSPESVALLPGGRAFRLSLSQNLQSENTYELSVVGLSDRAGNVISSTKKKAFFYDQQPPRLQRWQMIAPNQLRLHFHEELQTASARPPRHYTLDSGKHPDSVAVSIIHPGQVTLFFAQPLSDEILLEITEVADLYGNKLIAPLEVAISNQGLALGAVVPLSATEVRLDFTRAVVPSVMDDLDNYRLDGVAPIQAEVGGSYQSSVVLMWNTPLTANQTYPLTINRLVDVDGAIVESIKTDVVYDPKVANVIPDRSALTLEFTVPVDADAATNRLHYEVPEVGRPVVALLTGPRSVRLIFASRFALQTVHSLSIEGLLDQDRDIIPASQHPFGQGVAPAYHQLLITEMMADPSPAVGLPEVEYVELFNASDQLLSTQGLRFSDASTAVVLPATFLAPQEHVLLVDESDRGALSTYGRIMAVKSFPSLNSSGDSLRLTNEQGQEIFALAYADNWYNDAEKRGGGWSLEMVDTQRPCGEGDNWTASVDPTGGTPGRPNSVQQPNPDRFGPEVVRAFVASDTVVQVLFSERLGRETMASAKITLSDGLSARSVRWLAGQKGVAVTVNKSFQTRVTYSVTVRGVNDCSGNLISEAHATTTFVLPEVAVPGDLLLSELLFRPRSGGKEFVELYNRSSKPIDLKDWSLANLSGDSLVNVKSITNDHRVLAPGAYVALTEDPVTLKADYPAASEEHLHEVIALPSLPADQGTVLLLDPAQTQMQRFDYSADFHHPLLVNTRGVSLERITWEGPANDDALWQSAAQTANYATPGYRNSQHVENPASVASLLVDPPVFAPGHAGHADFTRIHYRFGLSGTVANVSVYDAQGRKVRDLARNLTLAEEGFLVWDGTANDQQRVDIGYYLIFFETFDTQGQVTVLKEKVVVGGNW